MSDNLPVIHCAVCNRNVDRIEVEANDYQATYHIRVWCHGDTDEMDLPWSALSDLSRHEIDQLRHGVTFTTKRLAVS